MTARVTTPGEIGRAIRQARRTQRLRLEDVALAAGTGIRFVSEIERGKTTARLAETLRVAHAVGLKLDLTGPGLDDAVVREPSLEQIRAAAADAYGVEEEALIGRDRGPRALRARQIAMYFARELTSVAVAEIGRYFGGRSESTVLRAYRAVQRDMKDRPVIRQGVGEVRARLQQEMSGS